MWKVHSVHSRILTTSTILQTNAHYIWYIHIQGVSRLVDITAGGDFLGLCDQKSSCKHVSNFGRLRSYRHFLIPVHALVWTASYQLAGDVLNLVAYRLRCKHYFCHLTHPPIYRQSSFCISTLGRYLRNVGWVGIRLASVYCMTQLLLCVQKPSSLTLQWLWRLLVFRRVRR